MPFLLMMSLSMSGVYGQGVNDTGGSGEPPDTTNPTLFATSPADNDTGIAIATAIALTFDENVAFGTGNVTLRKNDTGFANDAVYDVTTDTGRVSISGSTLTITPAANLDNNTEYAIRIDATAIDDLSGNSFAGIADDTTISFTTTPALDTGAVSFGAGDPDVISGPLGDTGVYLSPRGISLAHTDSGHYIYVDGSVGASGDGLTLLTAKKTIQEGWDMRGPGDSILVEPGVYPEKLFLDGFGDVRGTANNPIVLTKRGTGVVEITAADAPGGWAVCPNAAFVDENANYANIWYVDITADTGEPDLNDAILLEDGTVGSMTMVGDATTSTDSMLIPQHTTVWWNGDDTGSAITDLTKSADTGAITATASHFSTYPEGTLTNPGAKVLINCNSNTYVSTDLEGHDTGLGTLTFTNNSGLDWDTKQIAIRNVPGYIAAAGQWAARQTDTGTGAWRVFYWPHDTGAIDANVRISQRDRCIDLDAAENVVLFGLKLTGAGGGFPNDGRNATALYSTQMNIYTRDNIIVEQCHSIGNNVGGFNLTDVSNLQFYDNTSEVVLNGRAGDFTEVEDAVIVGNEFRMTGFTCVSLYDQNKTLFAQNSLDEVRSVHGNGSSIYLSARKLWFHANRINTKFAIQTTMQDAGDLFFTCNVISLGGTSASNRGLEDNSTFPAGYERQGGGANYDNVTTYFPTIPSITYASNTILPWSGYTDADATTGIQYANTTRCDHYVGGNLIYGGIERRDGTDAGDTGAGITNLTATVNVPENNNILVGTGDTGNPILFNGRNNRQEATAANVWSSPTSEGALATGSPADTGSGDHTQHLPISESWLTGLPGASAIVATDYNRRAITWVDAPTGAIAGDHVPTSWTNSAPVIKTKDPVDNDTGISVTKILEAVFDQSILFDTGTITLRENNGGWSDLETFNVSSDVDTGPGGVSVSGSVLKINPTANLTNSREYAIRISADAIEGYNGNISFAGIANDTGWSFTAQPSSGVTEPDGIHDTGDLQAWWDGRTGVNTTGSDVDQWTDQSTHGRNVTEGFAEPTYVSSTYIQFGDGVDDGLDGTTNDLSGIGTSDIWVRARLDDTGHNFVLITRTGNSTEVVIGESGHGGGPSSIGGTVYIDGVSKSTRNDVYQAFTDGGWHTVELRGATMTSMTDFSIQGYISSSKNAPMSIAQVAINTHVTTDSGTKRADMKTFLDTFSPA